MKLRFPSPAKPPNGSRRRHRSRGVPPPPARNHPPCRRAFSISSTHQLAHYPKPDALASKVDGEWRKYSTQEIVDTVRALAAGLRAAGVGPGDRVANVTENNRPEWNFIDLAVLQTRRGPRPDLSDADRRGIPVHPRMMRARNSSSLPPRRCARRSPASPTGCPRSKASIPMTLRRRATASDAALLDGPARCCGETLLREKPATGPALDASPPPCGPATSPRSSTRAAPPANPKVSCSRTPIS